MPIKGLSDKRRLPRLGKIHLGVRAKTREGKEYPRAVDYFVLPYEPADPTKLSSIGQQIAAIYGEKPRELDVMFPCDDKSAVFPQFYKSYRSGVGLWCKGDGCNATRVGENGTMEEIVCAGEGEKDEETKEVKAQPCPFYAEKKCKRMANLLFMLPRLGMGGCFQIDTSSYNSIVDINSGIDDILKAFGRLSAIPLKLRVVPRQASPEGKKKVIYTLALTPATYEESKTLLSQVIELRTLVAGGAAPQLPGPQQDKFEEQDLIPESVQNGKPEPPAKEGQVRVLPTGDRVDQQTGEVLPGDGGEIDIEDEQPEPPPPPAQPAQQPRAAAPRQAGPARPAGPAKPPAKRSGVSF